VADISLHDILQVDGVLYVLCAAFSFPENYSGTLPAIFLRHTFVWSYILFVFFLEALIYPTTGEDC
jgi:hypothetical protein